MPPVGLDLGDLASSGLLLVDADNTKRDLERHTANDVVRTIDRIVGLTPEQKAEAKPELSRYHVTWLLDVVE